MKRYLLLLLFLLPGILCTAQVEEEDDEEEIKQETIEKKKTPVKAEDEEEDDEEEEEDEKPSVLPPAVPHRHFMLNPFSFLLSGFEIGYGRCDEKKQYIRFYGGYYFSEEANVYNDGQDDNFGFFPVQVKQYKNMEQFRFELQFAKMFSIETPVQYYFGAYGVLKSLTVDVTKTTTGTTSSTSINYKAKASAFNPGLLLGIRKYFRQYVFVDVFGGGGIIIPMGGNNVDDIHRGTILPYKRSINARLGLSLGITF